MRPPDPKKLQERCDRFNERFHVGTPVKYHPVIGEVPGRETRTVGPAQVLSGHTAVIWLEGVRGCVALDAVEVLDLTPKRSSAHG